MNKQKTKRDRIPLKTFVNGKGAIQAERAGEDAKYEFRYDAFKLNDVPFDTALQVHIENLFLTYGKRTVMRVLEEKYKSESVGDKPARMRRAV